jgi:choline monooxygenase
LLLSEPCGQVSRLRCRYHGWTYDLTGRLRGTPEFEGVADFCKEEHGLVPLTVASWGPFVWVHASRQPLPLEQFLAPLIHRTLGLDLSRWHFVERREYDLACNWKVFVDNYLDGGYHVNYVHPGLAGILDYSQYHSEIFAESSVQLSPIAPPRDETSAPVAAVRTGTEAQYWWLYPNLMLNLYEGVMDTNLVLPLGPDRCRVVFDFYFADVGNETATARQQSMAVSHQIQLEDMGTCADVQRGLHSRSFHTGRFSVRREGPGYHFHQLLARRLRDALMKLG